MKFVDIFSGIGTVRMGMEQAGHECVYSIEWDKHKRRIYDVIFGKEPEGSDIRRVQSSDIPESDVWCFGFPCQDISVSGKQLGFRGDRSSLFFEVMRLLSEAEERNKPQYLLIENVKNLLSVNGGWDFFNLLYTLDSVGYDAEWELLNSRRFGVPHNRERVFVIGHLRGKSTRKVFPIEGTTKPVGVPIKRLAHANNFRRYNQTYDLYSSIETLDTCQGGGRQPCIMIKGRIRRLTPKEAWRLQGVPDYVIDKLISSGISDTQMYRGAGDACTVPVIYEIAKRL